jgi:hypothetical protein
MISPIARRTTTSSWFDKLTMRAKPLKTRDLILSLSKDEAKISPQAARSSIS